MGFVRIVGGALRGRRLVVPNRGVRPTAERTREAVFDILGPERVTGARVLDLYAGTGALGVEALSRGATMADFLEGDRTVQRALRGNLERLGLSDRATVHGADLSRISIPPDVIGPFDLVFLDPPYAGTEGARWLAHLAEMPWPKGGGLIVHERRKGTAVPTPPGLTLATERTYSETSVAFYHAGAS
jgi:16S rRNA (guanine966-N2)-methyltransferase